MKFHIASSVSLLALLAQPASALDNNPKLPGAPTQMERSGAALSSKELKAATAISFDDLKGLNSGIPTKSLSEILQKPISEQTGASRSAKDVQLYKSISPSVVLVAHEKGLGSGSLLNASGDVLTNYHVIKGNEYVAVIFKPEKEGTPPTRDDIRRGQVVKVDEVADLALVHVSGVPAGRSPIRLGNTEEISVGADVSAIGHPTGEMWTYTRGVVSQYRLGYAWGNEGEDIKHKADIIQTQTPINPGNSGGPLISETGDLIGVNSFKSTGEGLNFAVSVDEVKRFLARPGDRGAEKKVADAKQAECVPKAMNKFRNRERNATIVSYDMFCDGKINGEYVVPDKPAEAVLLRMDRNGDGQTDVVFFDLKRRGKWDLSFWDEKYAGQWTLVGYHDDGSLKPSRFESYATYQNRQVSSR